VLIIVPKAISMIKIECLVYYAKIIVKLVLNLLKNVLLVNLVMVFMKNKWSVYNRNQMDTILTYNLTLIENVLSNVNLVNPNSNVMNVLLDIMNKQMELNPGVMILVLLKPGKVMKLKNVQTVTLVVYLAMEKKIIIVYNVKILLFLYKVSVYNNVLIIITKSSP